MVSPNPRFLWNPGNRALLNKQGKCCFYCGGPLTAEAATEDHLRPRKEGRSLYLNKVMACRPCNVAKGCREPTATEIQRARAIYLACGMPAFGVPA